MARGVLIGTACAVPILKIITTRATNRAPHTSEYYGRDIDIGTGGIHTGSTVCASTDRRRWEPLRQEGLMEYKFGQTIIMERMYTELLEAMFFATTEELNDRVRNIVAEGCREVGKEAVEDYLDGAPWCTDDAVAQFKGE